MGPSFIAVNCSSCVSGYVYNFSSGGCAACPSNCVSCICRGDMYICTQTYCETCLEGFVLNEGICQLGSTSTISLQHRQLEEMTSAGSKNSSGVIIGLIIWGILMTLVVLGFGILYLKKKDNPQIWFLNETQTREVM